MSQLRDNIPNVPDGWKVIFDEEYKTWYYVDLKTGKSQWEPPKLTDFSKPAVPPPPRYGEIDSQGYQRQQQQPRYQGYPQQPAYPQQPVYQQQQQQPANNINSGMLSGLVGAGIGFIGGAMLANAIDRNDGPEIIENNYYYYEDDGGYFDIEEW